MAKVLVDLTPLYNRKITGVEIYGIELYQALMKTEHEIYPVFRMKNTLDNNPNAIIVNTESRLLVENYHLQLVLRKLRPQIAFFPIFPPPLNVYNNGIKIVPTIHDLAFKYYNKTLSLKARLYLVPKYLKALRRADIIITISNSIQSELCRETKIPVYNWGESISKIYDLHNYVFDNSVLNKYGLHERNYLITVSTIEPRKNVQYLLELWKNLYKQNLSLKLVFVGRNGWEENSIYSHFSADIKDSVIFTGYVDNDELINLYHYSKSFILLSLYEGFGRTPLEALACGANVIVSDIPSFRENLGEIGKYVTLNNRDKAVLQISTYLQEPQMKYEFENKWFTVIEDNVRKNINQLL